MEQRGEGQCQKSALATRARRLPCHVPVSIWNVIGLGWLGSIILYRCLASNLTTTNTLTVIRTPWDLGFTVSLRLRIVSIYSLENYNLEDHANAPTFGRPQTHYYHSQVFVFEHQRSRKDYRRLPSFLDADNQLPI